MAINQLLTTEDNPYNPFTQWDEWYAFDESKGYRTTGRLAKLVVSSDVLSDADQEDAIDMAMQEIVRDFTGIYKLVGPPTSDSEN